MGDRGWTRFDHALLAGCALFPASLAAAGVTSAAPASHDEGLVRTVALGWTGIFRGLDVILAAPFVALPVGTRALRVSLASAVIAGICGAIAFVIARAIVAAVRPAAASPRLLSAVAAALVLAGVLAPVWQAEAIAPGGTVTGALLVLAAIAIGQQGYARAEADPASDPRPVWRSMALVVGLAASYEPLVLGATAVALAPWIHGLMRLKERKSSEFVDALPAFALGLAPLALAGALSRRAPELAIAASRTFASPLGERAGVRVAFGPWALAEIGYVILSAAVAGGVLTALVPAARRVFASLLGVLAVGWLALALQAPSGPWHTAAPILAATLVLHVLAAVALAAAVVAISTARVPFAQASAALVVVLELVLPVRAADETVGRREARAFDASSVWTEVAWGAAPTAAVLLVATPSTMRRIAAARAVGQMRTDLLVVPTFAMPSRLTDRALGAEPKLAPLYRDVALGATPEELSLAQLASQRPLLAAFHPTWDRNLARHFVPVGLTTRFEPEPRGSSDRRRALDAFTAGKDRLARVAIAKKDPDLASATASLLRGRAIGIAACGERDVLSRALDDLRPFAPDDNVANTLVRRIVTSKGAIEVRDLVP